jgi:pimeloyl-ACP methyl ester carboxylesterase
MIWRETGGSGKRTILLLHGLGATAEVWRGLTEVLDRQRAGRWVVPDLPGHGRSAWAPPYSFGRYAADMGPLVAGAPGPVAVVGHSMGGVVALALASGWFGLQVEAVVGIGIKVSWTGEELARVRERASRPGKWFERREEAEAFFLRAAGLDGIASPGTPLAASGVVEEHGRFRLAADPAASLVGVPPMEGLMAASRAPVRLACGAGDGMVDVEQLRRLDRDAVELQGVGHSANVEDPERAWAIVSGVLATG